MPVTITVSQVRNALYHAGGAEEGRGPGAPSTAVLGTWFHEGLQFLVGSGSRTSALARLAELDADPELWKQALVATAYSQFVGPRLTRERAALKDHAPQVLAFWQAMQAACYWLAELNWSLRSERPSRRAHPELPWQSLADCLSTEEPLTCELREPGWTDSVRLVGIADAVVRLKHTGVWCAIEFKLGQAAPVADLGQACLYHLMLASAGSAQRAGEGAILQGADREALALISFRPQRHERVYSSGELATAKQKLIELVGKLAGVARAEGIVLEVPSSRAAPPHTEAARSAGSISTLPQIKAEPTAEHLELGRKLVKTFAEFGVTVKLDEPIVAGPAFIRYPIEPGRAVKRGKIEKTMEELRSRLRLDADPFLSFADGRLVIDVQRPDRQKVWFDEIRGELTRSDSPIGSSRIPVGVDLYQRLIFADLSKTEHAHLLVAGTTGSGKSEWLRLAIAGLVATNTPETLRLLVIDPKRNAFHALRESPYLWKPLIFPDEHPTIEVLEELVEEMERRYRLFEGLDNLSEYIRRSGQAVPRIVCVCDEYRDLISRSRAEREAIEQLVCRLAAKSRAAGIHLILATQQPSRESITGRLDANISARVGLRLGKALESRMLLGQSGAENLLGHGDLLFKDIGEPRRLQAPLLSEVNRQELFR